MKIIMKKSILLNEDEKNRILNLHETAKNLYENKKPVSSIKETNIKKEDMKKVIKLTESDLEKIVRRVIEEQYMGVAFGGEQNGLKIKKMETKEQVMTGPAKQGNVAPAKPKIDPAILRSIQATFPTPARNDVGEMSFVRNDTDFSKYDNIVKYLANSVFGRAKNVMDISNAKDMETINKGIENNNGAILALYDGVVSIAKNGYAKSLEDLTKYGNMGENIRQLASGYLDKAGIKYPA